MKLKELIHGGELVGYEAGAPSYQAMIGDAEVCDQATCRACGHEGMMYHPYTHQNGIYRAFAVCPDCGEAEEF